MGGNRFDGQFAVAWGREGTDFLKPTKERVIQFMVHVLLEPGPVSVRELEAETAIMQWGGVFPCQVIGSEQREVV